MGLPLGIGRSGFFLEKSWCGVVDLCSWGEGDAEIHVNTLINCLGGWVGLSLDPGKALC